MRCSTTILRGACCLLLSDGFAAAWLAPPKAGGGPVRFGTPGVRHGAQNHVLLGSNGNGNGNGGDPVLENEEPLSVIFQRGLVLQRSGDLSGALKEYQFFVKAAEGCGVSPEMFAEVHVNIGAVYFRDASTQDLAERHFRLALEHRPIGTAFVNLALIALRKGSTAGAADPVLGRECLEEARSCLLRAIELDDSDQTTEAAKKLLEDVDAIARQMNRNSGR